MAVEVRMAEGEEDAIRAFRLYKQMHDEGSVPGTFHPLKTLSHILRFINGPDSLVLLAMEGGQAVGVLSLVKAGLWWSEDGRFFEDKGLYVVPEHRDGEALKLLLDDVVNLSNDTGIPVFITINSGRRRRGGRSEWERIGATLGYVNRGATLAHFPEN